jgi:hypothetical protein
VDTAAGGARNTRKGKCIARRSRRPRRGNETEGSYGGHRGWRGEKHAAGRTARGSLGAGRAKLRLSRGFTGCPARSVNPHQILGRIISRTPWQEEKLHRGHRGGLAEGLWSRPRGFGKAHTSGISDNLELTGCLRSRKFLVFLSLLVILSQHRQVRCLRPSSLHPPRRCRPRPHRHLVLCLRSNRCQHRLRSRLLFPVA